MRSGRRAATGVLLPLGVTSRAAQADGGPDRPHVGEPAAAGRHAAVRDDLPRLLQRRGAAHGRGAGQARRRLGVLAVPPPGRVRQELRLGSQPGHGHPLRPARRLRLALRGRRLLPVPAGGQARPEHRPGPAAAGARGADPVRRHEREGAGRRPGPGARRGAARAHAGPRRGERRADHPADARPGRDRARGDRADAPLRPRLHRRPAAPLSDRRP